jgi:hypothetical protein
MLPLLIPLAPHLVRAATSRRPQQQPQLRPTPPPLTSQEVTPTPQSTPSPTVRPPLPDRAGAHVQPARPGKGRPLPVYFGGLENLPGTPIGVLH